MLTDLKQILTGVKAKWANEKKFSKLERGFLSDCTLSGENASVPPAKARGLLQLAGWH